MALPYLVTFGVTDGEGKTGQGRFYIDSAQTVANAVTEATGLLGNIAAMVAGRITSAQLSVQIDPSGITNNPASPDPQSNRRYKHRWSLSSAEGHEAILTVPAADQAESVDGSNEVDTGVGTPGETLAADIITRPLVTSHDEPITVVLQAVEVFGR